MKWSIHQLAKYRQTGLPIDTVVNLDEVKERNKDIREISPVHVKGHCTVGNSQMTCHLTLKATLTLPCARTWEDVQFPVEVETVEVFSWEDPELRGNDDDEDIHYIDGEVVDLKPVLEELILLEVPMQVFKEGTEGAIKGGKDWDYFTEEELSQQAKDEPKVDPRLAGLAKFFDQKDE
ncbi:YceD family protein [Ureibacillus sp. FSL K6-8385]|uniref:DUF177 domain-containing protein n=1 Tax=Ureibacillus terrenus TaxID=118246 RepID=A0A540V492_9BACL|nr:YceD family protein [Ureibacillus terrenus]MED3660301.1 YceD family protein [Ureibacillus terrenus]MED3764953.1 YceD family protein [Ureibacillus terrenus]TQE91528.1 hypothetical protein FKZ59_04080 [Ureibacillus terrenus]